MKHIDGKKVEMERREGIDGRKTGREKVGEGRDEKRDNGSLTYNRLFIITIY